MMKKTEVRIEVDRTVTIRRFRASWIDESPDDNLRGSSDPIPQTEQAIQLMNLAEQPTRRIAVVEDKPARRAAAGLRQDGFDRLLGVLDPDRERAGQKYEAIRRKLVKFFECNRCAFPEDYADATIDRVAAKIADDLVIESNDYSRFFYGVARNVLREYWRQAKKEPLSLEQLAESGHNLGALYKLPEDQTGYKLIEQQHKSLDECLWDLPSEWRELILQYYCGENGAKIENRKMLARRLAIPLNTLRIRVHRIRERLKQRMGELICEEVL